MKEEREGGNVLGGKGGHGGEKCMLPPFAHTRANAHTLIQSAGGFRARLHCCVIVYLTTAKIVTYGHTAIHHLARKNHWPGLICQC